MVNHCECQYQNSLPIMFHRNGGDERVMYPVLEQVMKLSGLLQNTGVIVIAYCGGALNFQILDHQFQS